MKEYRTALCSRTPSKIILSGEHAVVYGKPALAMSVNRYFDINIDSVAPPNQLILQLQDFNQQHVLSSIELIELKAALDQRYQQFTDNHIRINQVVQQPYELIAYTIAEILKQHQLTLADLDHGLKFTLHSEIPIGCGMGSSGASIVGTITALCYWLNIKIEPQACYELAHRIENLQHGRSSGIDIRLAQYGGTLKFQQGNITTRPLLQLPFVLVNTGTPESSTGECVSYTKTYFHNSDLADRFAQVTQIFDHALLTNDHQQLHDCLRQNHRLLTQIDAVPIKVQHFITEIERRGGAGKICGAGSITGEHGGIALVSSEQNITDLCDQYGYSIMQVRGANQGSHVILQTAEAHS